MFLWSTSASFNIVPPNSKKQANCDGTCFKWPSAVNFRLPTKTSLLVLHTHRLFPVEFLLTRLLHGQVPRRHANSFFVNLRIFTSNKSKLRGMRSNLNVWIFSEHRSLFVENFGSGVYEHYLRELSHCLTRQTGTFCHFLWKKIILRRQTANSSYEHVDGRMHIEASWPLLRDYCFFTSSNDTIQTFCVPTK